MKLGNGEDLIDHYGVLHGMNDFPTLQEAARDFYMYTVGLSADVLRACCDEDISSLLTDVVDRNGVFKIKKPSTTHLTVDQQIIVAAGLMRHGVSGVSDKKSTSKGKAATTVDLWSFVNTARIHLGISKSEALSLTMTEFNRMVDIKFPPEKSITDTITDDQYAAAMKNLDAINKIRDAK